MRRKDRVAISTYLYETGGAVAADPSGAIYFSGPNTLVGKLNPVGHLEYLAHGTSGAAMALSGSQRVAVAGAIRDFSLPTFGAYRAYSDAVFPSNGGNGDGFLSILAEGPNLDATREQDDAAVTYTGTWTTVTSPGSTYSGGSAVESEEAGATATIRFTGTGVQVLGLRSPRSGFLRYAVFDETRGGTAFWAPYQLGGVIQDRRVDTYASEEEARSLLISLEGLTPGDTYRLTLSVEGSRNPRSLGNRIDFDGFNVLGGR